VKGLDMSDYIIKKDGDCIYDLYAVVNHSGTLNSGHYTALCYNEPRDKWMNFNDSHVN
jgi:ubiquitin C-terminal hydrolase